ncbi:MAG TPA: transglutaminase, partial [Burkholderiaceae bacterium]|nr:transglutaminase [Burkholderiaceae bacterium]
MSMNTNRLKRREWLALTTTALAAAAWPGRAAAQARRFDPQPGDWRRFEITTQVEIANPNGASRVWLPMPSIDTAYQQSLDSQWAGNATRVKVAADTHYGAKMLAAEFDAGVARPTVQ